MLLFANQSFGQKAGTIVNGLEVLSSTGNDEFKILESSIDLGMYTTKWLALCFRVSLTSGMFDNSSSSMSSRLTKSIGPDLSFIALTTNHGVLSVNTSCGSTIGGGAWKYTCYSGGIYYNYGKSNIKPFLGLGIKYFDSHTSNFNDYARVYISCGFRWNDRPSRTP